MEVFLIAMFGSTQKMECLEMFCQRLLQLLNLLAMIGIELKYYGLKILIT